MIEEREIDLLDLIAEVLSHWRGAVVMMLIGAVLLGTFSYAKSYSAISEQTVKEEVLLEELSKEEQLALLDKKLTETEKATVLMVIDDETEYAIKKEYAENSAYMQMNPFHVARRELFYRIQIEDMGQSYDLGAAYGDLLYSGTLYQWVEEQTGILATNAKELIAVYTESNVTILNGGQETTSGNDSLKIILLHADEKECEKLAEAVKSYIDNIQELLEKEFGAHEIILFSEGAGNIIDTGIMDKQIANNNSMMTLISTIAKTKDAFSEIQKDYYDLLTQKVPDEENTMEIEEQIVTIVPSIDKKYVLLGAIFFAIMYAGIFVVNYIISGKLHATNDLQKIYHIPQIGFIVKETKKRPFFLDAWIEALRNHGKRQFTREQSIELATTAVKISATKNGFDSICLMGCDLKAGADVVCNSLKEALEQENFEVMVIDNVLYDAAAMAKLENVKGVVLVEKVASTMYREISEELELTERQGITVLGGIVVA